MSFVGWALSLLNEPQLEPVVERMGWAWCSNCDQDREIDVIPANTAFSIPAFAICMRCGWGVDFEGDAA